MEKKKSITSTSGAVVEEFSADMHEEMSDIKESSSIHRSSSKSSKEIMSSFNSMEQSSSMREEESSKYENRRRISGEAILTEGHETTDTQIEARMSRSARSSRVEKSSVEHRKSLTTSMHLESSHEQSGDTIHALEVSDVRDISSLTDESTGSTVKYPVGMKYFAYIVTLPIYWLEAWHVTEKIVC
jgi:hypothetical protein